MFPVQNPGCCLIAEIGVNHGGDLVLAKEMVMAAKRVGADAVKFQTFSAARLVNPGTPKVKYQESTTSPKETHYDMIRSLELSLEDHRALFDFCRYEAIEFISTPYDVESARFLDELGCLAFKTASADIVDLDLHRFLASTGKPVLISTGMASLGEIEECLHVYGNRTRKDLVLLHCVSNYPCSDASLNLRVLPMLAAAFGCRVGFSDHSVGSEAAMVSVALGAIVIEKHFTTDRALPGPDHAASVLPEEFAQLVSAVRRVELMLGSAIKELQPEEAQMASVSRKSITLVKALVPGEALSREHVTLKRPGTGLLARELPALLGRKARYALPVGRQLRHSDLE